MTALKIFGIFVLLLFLLSFVRIGVQAEWGEEVCVKLRIGPIRQTIVPGRKKTPKEEETKGSRTKGTEKAAGWKAALKGHSREEWLSLARSVLRVLGRAGKRVRVEPLQCRVVFAGSDPVDTAQIYGAACAALWTFMPMAEQALCIPHPGICLDMDFQAEQTRTEGTLGVSLRVRELLRVACALAAAFLRWYWRWRRTQQKTMPPPAASREMAGENPTG